MTVINGSALLRAAPLSPMLATKERAHGVTFGLGEAGFDIRLKEDVRFEPPNPARYWVLMRAIENLNMSVEADRFRFLDLNKGAHEAFCGYTEVVGASGKERRLGRFALASSLESFQMPDDVVAIFHDKSTHARRAISVFNTVLEPGWGPSPDRPDEGCFLTIEIVFHGDTPITIPAGSGIGQLIFHRIEEPAHYTGRYTGQPSRAVAAIMEG